MNKIEKLKNLESGLTFAKDRVSTYKKMIFDLEKVLKGFQDQVDRIENEIETTKKEK
jgi:hypothetical protein